MGGFLTRWMATPLVFLSLGFGAGWKLHDWKDAAAEVGAIKHVVQVVGAQGAISTAAAAHDQAARDRIQTITRIIVEEVPAHVTPAADARCIVPLGFVREHDAAASGDLSTLSQSPGRPDDAASGLALSDVAHAVVGNYGSCRGIARQLNDLEDWVAAQKAASS